MERRYPSTLSLFAEKIFYTPYFEAQKLGSPTEAFRPLPGGFTVSNSSIYILAFTAKPFAKEITISPDRRTATIIVEASEDLLERKEFFASISSKDIDENLEDNLVIDSINCNRFDSRFVDYSIDGKQGKVPLWWLCHKSGEPLFQGVLPAYVGRSTSKNYKDGALDRLFKGHATLAKVNEHRGDNQEVLLIMIEPNAQPSYTLDNPPAPGRIIREDQRVWLTPIYEAALIHYLQPPFNSELKPKYPTNKINKLARSLGFDRILCEYDAENLGLAFGPMVDGYGKFGRYHRFGELHDLRPQNKSSALFKLG